MEKLRVAHNSSFLLHVEIPALARRVFFLLAIQEMNACIWHGKSVLLLHGYVCFICANVCVCACVFERVRLSEYLFLCFVLALIAFWIFGANWIRQTEEEKEEVRKATNGHVIDTNYALYEMYACVAYTKQKCISIFLQISYSTRLDLILLLLLFASYQLLCANGHHHSSLFKHFNYDHFVIWVDDINNDRSLHAPNIFRRFLFLLIHTLNDHSTQV